MPDVIPITIPKNPPDPGNPAKPDDNAVIVTGSKSVYAAGTNFSRLGDLAMSCAEPVRFPSTTVLAFPKGRPVLVGGMPTIDMLAAVGAFIRTQWVSQLAHSALLRHLRPGRLRSLLRWTACVLTGHPVDVASGRVLTQHIDFALPGPLPVVFERIYNSGFSSRSGPLGYGWSHSFDQRVWEERGKVVYLTDDGREVEFDTFDLPGRRMRPGDELFYPVDRLTLKCLDDGRWEVWTLEGIGHELGPVEGGEPGVARLLAMKTRDGHRVELRYDERARLSQLIDSSGRDVRFDNDAEGRVLAIRLPNPGADGHFVHTRFGYDERGDLVAVSDPAGHSWEFAYEGHLLTCETDRERLSFYFGYDGIGEDAWCIRTWGDGGIYDHSIAYDKKGKVTFVTNSLGHTTTYRMDIVGKVVEQIDPHGNVTSYEYDPSSLQPTEVRGPGASARVAYDERGQVVRIEAADGGVTSAEYDPRFLDRPVLARSPNGHEWRWTYDAFARQTGRGNPHGHWTRYEYAEGLLRSVTTPGGAETRLEYGDHKLPVRITAAGGIELTVLRDRLGRLVFLQKPGGGVERREYDRAGNLTRVEDEEGFARRFEYDREQNLTRAADPLRDVSFTYTGLYRMHERIEAGTTVRVHYDTEDDVTSIENEAGEVYELERDARGLVVAERGFHGDEVRYGLDAAGHVTSVKRASGATSKVTVDALGRATRVEHDDGTFERYRFGLEGELLEASNEAAELHFECDPFGRVVRELTRLPDGTERWVRSGYGPDGHRVRVESSEGHLHHIERAASGEVTAVELEHRRWRVDLKHDPRGFETSRRFPSGVESRWERDAKGRPTRRVVSWRGEGAPPRTLGERRFEWHADDQLEAVRDSRDGDTTYRHDARGRLVEGRLPWGEVQHRAVDSVDNVYREPSRGDRTYGPGGKLLESDGTTYRHDEDGHLVEKTDVLGDTTRFRWKRAGYLSAVELPDGRSVLFDYDALGRRLLKRVVTVEDERSSLVREVRWAWDGDVPLRETDSQAGATTWLFEPGSLSPIAKLTERQVWGVLTDQLGTPTELLAEDGSPAARTLPDLYGAPTAERMAEALPFGWPGQQWDTETGLLYNRHRYLDPAIDAYLSPDPIRLHGGLRPYAYVPDPLVQFDPFGLAVCVHQKPRNRLVMAFARELDDAVQDAAARLAAGAHDNTIWGILYHHRFLGTPLELMARGNAIQQMAEGVVQSQGSAYQRLLRQYSPAANVLWNQGSVTGARGTRLLRPDVQIVGRPLVHILDITTPAQAAAGMINKYNVAGLTGGLIDITY